MSRPTIATLLGILFVIIYIILAVSIPDFIGRLHWAAEAAYWCVMGVAWVLPIRWLMLWSVHKR